MHFSVHLNQLKLVKTSYLSLSNHLTCFVPIKECLYQSYEIGVWRKQIDRITYAIISSYLLVVIAYQMPSTRHKHSLMSKDTTKSKTEHQKHG